jgi:ABC-type transport system involved in cytochrome c biogenesis permease subunit
MARMETFSLLAALISLSLSAVMHLWGLVPATGQRAKGRGHTDGTPGAAGRPAGRTSLPSILMLAAALLFLTLSIVARATATGHGPFSNMYEFSVAFCWGIMASSLYFQWRYKIRVVTAAGVIIALALLAYAYTLPSRHVPLAPALQQSLLLSFHVASAMLAYGMFAVGFGAAAVYLVRRHYMGVDPGRLELLENTAHNAVLIGFPFMTLTIILGALWADIAWGRYWGWDPKETSSLVTWLVYAAYLHARVLRGWRGSKSVFLIVVGFLAVLFTYFGNYYFGGLHGYR